MGKSRGTECTMRASLLVVVSMVKEEEGSATAGRGRRLWYGAGIAVVRSLEPDARVEPAKYRLGGELWSSRSRFRAHRSMECRVVSVFHHRHH